MLVIDFLQFLIFPGLILTLYFSITSAWLFRKLMARMENRVGPPMNQPAFDLAKLMAKERIYPTQSIKWIAQLLPRIQVGIALFMSFFIPIIDEKGLISFDGDVFVFMFLLALHGSIAFFIGWGSRNPYTISGAGRAVLTEISLEIPLALSLAGISILTGSMRISEISSSISTTIFNNDAIGYLFIVPWIVLLVVTLYSTLGALEMNPFSAAHAETEIVGGWNTELTGSDLAMTKLADMVNLFNIAGLVSAMFLGGPILVNFAENSTIATVGTIVIAFITFLIKILVVLFLLTFVATTSSRLRIDQITDVLWAYFLPIAMFGILLVMGIKSIGGS